MQRFALVGLMSAIAACEAAPVPHHVVHPVGYASTMESAQEHERRADLHDQIAREHETTGPRQYACGDSVLNDTLTSGGAPVTNWVPCWNVDEEGVQRHRDVAARERAAARGERRAAAQLVENEVAACKNISDAEREHSPFVHRRDIAEVIPHKVGGSLRGARVVFDRVPALTADWMRQDIACHRAHVAVLGHVPESLATDPTVQPGTTATVSEQNGQVVVLVEAPTPEAATTVLAQAQGTPAQTAER